MRLRSHFREGRKNFTWPQAPDPDKADSAFRSAGEWCLPGGKLEWGESFEDGAIRETLEETGISIKNPKVISVHNCKNEHAHFLTVGLRSEEWEGEAKVWNQMKSLSGDGLT